MRIVVCWASLSGYMAACWRALAAMPGVDLLVISPHHAAKGLTNFKPEVVRDLNCRVISDEQLADAGFVAELVAAHKPDLVVVPGWIFPAYRALPLHPTMRDVRFVMTMDTPYRGDLRQRVGRFVHRRFFSRIHTVMVAGERAFQFARLLGFDESRTLRGTYGIDYDAFAPTLIQRLASPGGWPRAFLYQGRYVEEKGIANLLAAYSLYRGTVADPWPLTMCGMGPLAGLAAAAEGVTDLGFVQPADQPAVLIRHGAFVLASRRDPWPLVVVESCAAGLPVICTEACGSAVELVRPYYSGITCATGNPPAMAAAMRWLHEHHELLPEFGKRATRLAEAYSARYWALRLSRAWADWEPRAG